MRLTRLKTDGLALFGRVRECVDQLREAGEAHAQNAQESIRKELGRVRFTARIVGLACDDMQQRLARVRQIVRRRVQAESPAFREGQASVTERGSRSGDFL